MSQFTAYQTQQITFTDTSSGGSPPLSRLWSFPGGKFNTATGATAQVSYLTPGVYTVTLTVTDDSGLSDSRVENNILNILPGFVTSSFTKNSTVALMSQPLTFTSTSTGLPSAPNSFGWKYAGESASTPVWNSGFYGDWTDIPGANISDAPGTEIKFNVTLSTSSGPFTSSSSQFLPVQKLGFLETFYLNTTNGFSDPYQTNFSVEIFNDGAIPYKTVDFGYPGDFLIYKLTVNSTAEIQGFHTNEESCEVVCTGFLPTKDGLNSTSGYLMVTDNIYGLGEIQIQAGQYILNSVLSSPVVDLYITGDNTITSLFSTYNWSLSLLNEIFGYPYPVTHSAQQYPLGFSFPSSALSKGGLNPILPSPAYFSSLGIEGEYQIVIEVNYDSEIVESLVTFNANGGNGNEVTLDGTSVNFYVAQDTSEGEGIATTINAQLAIDLPGGTGDVLFESGTQYSVMPGSSPSDYNGIIMKVLNPNIFSVKISDNSEEITSISGFKIPSFSIDVLNPPEDLITCTGILDRLELSTYLESGFSKVSIGGSLF